MVRKVIIYSLLLEKFKNIPQNFKSENNALNFAPNLSGFEGLLFSKDKDTYELIFNTTDGNLI